MRPIRESRLASATATVLAAAALFVLPSAQPIGPVGNVRTDTSNTWATGTQSFASATALIVPGAGGAAPTADGDLRYDTTDEVPVIGANGITTRLVHTNGCLVNGTTNNSNSGSGSDFAHNLSTTFAANTLKAGRVMRITQGWNVITGSASPTINVKIKFGSTLISAMGSNQSGVNNVSSPGRLGIVQTYLVVTAVGASGSVIAGEVVNRSNIAGNVSSNGTGSVTIDTTASQTLTHVSQWGSAGTGTNTIQLAFACVEVVK